MTRYGGVAQMPKSLSHAQDKTADSSDSKFPFCVIVLDRVRNLGSNTNLVVWILLFY